MIGMHDCHRRMAVITLKAEQLGGYDKLSKAEQVEMQQSLKLNAAIVIQMDEWKNLAFVAHTSGDHEWEQQICQKIDALEAKRV